VDFCEQAIFSDLECFASQEVVADIGEDSGFSHQGQMSKHDWCLEAELLRTKKEES